jgi:hypothetical protein
MRLGETVVKDWGVDRACAARVEITWGAMRGAHRVGVVEAQNRLSTESLLVSDACLAEVKVHGLHRPQSAS